MTDGDRPEAVASQKKKRAASAPLKTQQVFFDTQVYFKLKHNPANRAPTLLAEHIVAHRIVLQITDIALAEIRRQIVEQMD